MISNQSKKSIALLKCIAIVGFDLIEGQVISYAHPKTTLADSFLKNLAAIAFPDSSSFNSEGELFYFVNLTTENEELFAYIAFNQKKDPTNERGYHQSSTIIVSEIKSISLMKVLVSKLNSLYALSNYKNDLIDEFYLDILTLNEPLEVLLNQEPFYLKFFGGQLKVEFKRV